MKNKLLFNILLASTTALSLLGVVKPTSAEKKISYKCDLDRSQLATVANTPSGKVRIIDWEQEQFVFGEQNIIELCQQVSKTMQGYAAEGMLNYISTGSLNNQRFVCVSDKEGKCLQNAEGDLKFLFYLQTNQTAENVLKKLFNVSSVTSDRQASKFVVDVNQLLGKQDGYVAANTNQPSKATSQRLSRLEELRTIDQIDSSQNSKPQEEAANRETENNSNRVSYECVNQNGKYQTVAYTRNGPVRLIQWSSEFFSSSGYTPEMRCALVTDRFQRHYNANTLKFVTTGRINNQPVICVAEKVGNDYVCKSNGLLLTLEPRDNPTQILRSLFDLAARTSSGPLRRGGQVVIDLEDFLNQAKPMESRSGLSS